MLVVLVRHGAGEKSSEVDAALFTEVVDFLQSIPGPINFIYDQNSTTYIESEARSPYEIRDSDHSEKKIMPPREMTRSDARFSFPLKRDTISWSTLFNKANQYRVRRNIHEKEFVLILTDIANKENWFAALDEKMPYNGFIHSADWDYYIKCSAVFPIAYEVMSLVLQKHIFDGLYDLRTRVHEHPIGCVSDFCAHKRDIILKLRTGDMCEACIEKTNGKISGPDLATHYYIKGESGQKKKISIDRNLVVI